MNKRLDDLTKWYKEYIYSRDIFFNFIEGQNTFSNSVLKASRPILFSYNTIFQFERKGNNREGALTQKRINVFIDKKEILVKVIKIRKDTSFENQIHTYFHELAHLVNIHNKQIDIKLSTPQKEYVAEVVAQALLFSFCGGKKIDNLEENNKWDQKEYINLWIKNAIFSKKKIEEMQRQIIFSYDYISKVILNYKK